MLLFAMMTVNMKLVKDMFVVWDNTVNQDEIGSYDDVPEFESEDPAEVANWLKQNA
jgi:hypothetical protein